MSLALSTSARLKPDIRLARAVSEFEADLTSKLKATFRTYRSQARERSPEPSDVMRLTARIDSVASSSLRSMQTRCVGPRMTNLLSAIQQYVSMGDIIVGGSQNLIACGVWALVRTSVMLAVHHTAYLEKLSVLFMNAGRTAPRYQQLALLYQRSKPLQAHFCEYLIVVVRICHQVLKFSNKSYLAQLASSLTDADIKGYQSELDLWATSIKEEVTVLLSESIEDEAIQNSRFRAMSHKFSDTAAHRQRVKERFRILDSCSSFNHQTPWKQARKVGNTGLFVGNAEYEEWKTSRVSNTLICTGKLGSGKSVLLANIVDDLSLHAEEEKLPVAYFFCRHDIPDSLQPRTIIGSLLRQLLSTTDSLQPPTESFSNSLLRGEMELAALLVYFFNTFKPSSPCYFVLDGLDECAESDQETVLTHCRIFQKRLDLVLCVSYRLGMDNRLQLGLNQFASPTIFSISENNPEIEAFIDAELHRRLSEDKLRVGDPGLILEIRDALLQGAQGMFLWVALQISSICAEKTDEQIRRALVNLPKNLSGTFRQVLEKAAHHGRTYQRPILELVTVARQPLTAEQLREAISVVPGDTEWNPARLVNDIHSTLACCGSLIIIDEEEDTIRLVHHSVKNYLVDEFAEDGASGFSRDDANKRMCQILITYLNYDVFESQISRKVVPTISGHNAPQRIIDSIGSSQKSKALALRLLHNRPNNSLIAQPPYNLGKALADYSKQFKTTIAVEAFTFHSYAIVQWLYHTASMPEVDEFLSSKLVRLFEKMDTQSPAPPWKQESMTMPAMAEVLIISASKKEFHVPAAIRWALQNSHLPLLQYCMRSSGSLTVASIFIELRRLGESSTHVWPWHKEMCTYLLSFAMLQGSWPLIKELTEQGASINIYDY
ncbi:Vegetative incompatibility protein [Paramyrothecium foliicola]|nr:Vegetative incompatibility protein [Paramyrothecium foliicola]